MAALEGKHLEVTDPESDIDFAVLFKTHPENTLETYASLSLALQELVSPFKADLLFLHEVDHLIQLEAIKGINIYSFDDGFRNAYEERVMMFAADELEILKLNEKDLFEAIDNGYEDDFLGGDGPAVAENYIRRALEAMFDIGRHITAKSAGKGIVEYKEIATSLHNMGVITKEYSEKLKLMEGYRNRLVHFYHEISDKELFSLLKNNITDMEEFVKEIKNFLEKYRRN
ncbi:MAG: DUF86 domain-containing protein [Thermodesulfovibrionales bacterium]|nr:DUF86 domain-containing protein [Thermodesulfovibrionales bacterium]